MLRLRSASPSMMKDCEYAKTPDTGRVLGVLVYVSYLTITLSLRRDR
ncbi:hypothetical protein G1C95_2217 [Bifidobacterium sp. DSM 109957]|uniref:Uncharacterized protein n=1 Tax=Bifidobacterium oedipodis TaxID=2675322 RepID=A0A7Y0HUR2_9BIFI|nr:hypothetical protein [Bifidobacterium sp. DSM 109957]